MYCPNCGKENSSDQRFCRSCGLSLQTISQVVDHIVKATQHDKREKDGSDRRQSIWGNPLLYAGILFALGLVIITIGRRLIGEQAIVDMGTLLAVAGVALFIIKGIFLINQSRSPVDSGKAKADTTNKLPPLLEAKEQPSVTEFTTRNFDRVYAERKATGDSSESRSHSDA